MSDTDFQPSRGFTGSRPGYLFQLGSQGVGYYRDAQQTEPEVEDTEDLVNAHGGALDPQELLRVAEEQANVDQIQELDGKSLRRLIVSFEKKYKENLDLRMKFGDQPLRYLDSEVDLVDTIKGLMQVAGSPELYTILVDSGIVLNLLACTLHENTDVAADVIELFMELTSADAVFEAAEESRALVDAMLEGNALELLSTRLPTFNETIEEEAAAVHNCLEVFENMIEVLPDVADMLGEKTTLLSWLLARIQPKAFDSNKQYASEILAVLVQGSEKNQKKLGSFSGVETLLQVVSRYRVRDPPTFEEREFMQNVFDLLCSVMLVQEHKVAFVKAQGVELMCLILSSKRQSRYGALKLLDFCMTSYGQPCEEFVDRGGLKNLFGVFMGKARIKGPQDSRDVEREIEERSVSIISSLLGSITKGSRRDRVAAKFVESEFEKCDRLLEIYFKYGSQVAAAEIRHLQERAAAAEEDEAEEDEDVEDEEAEELLQLRMDAGLYSLQQCSIIIGHLWATSDSGLRKRILALLHQKGQTLADIRLTILEFYNSIDQKEGTDGGEAGKQLARLRAVLEVVGFSFDSGSAEQQALPAVGIDAMVQDIVKNAEGVRPESSIKDQDQAPPPPPLPPYDTLVKDQTREPSEKKGDGPRTDRPAGSSHKASESARPEPNPERSRRDRNHSSRDDEEGQGARHKSEPERIRNGEGATAAPAGVTSSKQGEHGRTHREQPESSRDRDGGREQSRSHDRDRHRQDKDLHTLDKADVKDDRTSRHERSSTAADKDRGVGKSDRGQREELADRSKEDSKHERRSSHSEKRSKEGKEHRKEHKKDRKRSRSRD